jgi:hypothetical protein
LKNAFATLAVISLFASANLFADCATSPWSSDNTNGVYTTTCAKVGIGTATPGQKLHIFDSADVNTFFVLENNNSTGTSAAAIIRAKADAAQVNFQAHGSGRTISRFGVSLGAWNEFLGVSGNGLVIGTNTGAGPLILGTAAVARIHILTDGKVGIGNASPSEQLDVTGNIHSTGSISADGALYAKFQDIAEWVSADRNLAPGTVVVLNPEEDNQVMASTTAYDTSVAGVVSEQPGITLGVRSAGKEQVATTGRVKVRIDTNSAPIRIGDLLVTGHQPGTAMRSEAMEMNGRKFHQPGTIIGKALQAHAGGEGEILVLLSLQ